jgi:hypothetical protein
MASSLEKVSAFTAELQGPPSADPDPFELAIKTAAQIGAPMLEQLLDGLGPAELDEYLEKVASVVLSMRSDEAPAIVLNSGVVTAWPVDEERRELPAG